MKRQSILFGSMLLMGSALVAKILGAWFRIPLTAMLGGTGMGYYSCAYGLFLPVFALSVTGMNTAVSALTAQALAWEQTTRAQQIRKLAMRQFGLLGLLGSGLLVCLAKPFCTVVLDNPQAALAVQCFAPACFFCCVNAVLRGTWEGRQCMTPTAVSQAVESAARLGCGLFFCAFVLRNFPLRDHSMLAAWLPSDTTPIAAAAAAAVLGVTCSTGIGTLCLLCWRQPSAPRPPQLSRTERRVMTRQLIAILLPIAASSLVTNLTSLIDLGTGLRGLRSAVLAAPESFGLSNACATSDAAQTANFLFGAFSGLSVTVFNLVPSVTNCFGKSMVPAFAEAHAQHDRSTQARHAQTAMQTVAFLAIPAGLGIVALATPILQLLFPSRPAEVAVAAAPLAILGVAVIFLCLSFPLFSMLQASGHGGATVRVMLWGVMAKLCGNLLLIRIPALHLKGAALATLLCYAVIWLRAGVVFQQKTGISLHACRICCPPVIAGTLCVAAACCVRNCFLTALGASFALLLGIAVGGAVYLLASWCLRPTKTACKQHGKTAA